VLTREELVQRRDRFARRNAQYLGLGHDRLAAAAFVAEAAGEGPASVLDVGTGKGLLALALARRGLRVTSVDLDADEQALAALMAEEAGVRDRIVFQCADAASLPHETGSFDAVASMDALHHFGSQGPILGELARVLRQGGRMVLADFTEEGFALVSRIHAGEGHEHPRSAVTLDSAVAFLEGLGFSVLDRSQGHLQDRALLRKDAAHAAR
jgi:2-polyprenyl-3-methyl-5-hydroxy-6-metoxy-1,4-benzoquinol methylase